MGNSTEKATQNGEKVYAVLRAKGRPHYEAKRDAESWVLGNYGLKVAIHPAQGTDGTEHHHNAPRPTCQVCGSPTPPPGWICFNCWTKARNTAQKEQAAGDRKNMRRNGSGAFGDRAGRISGLKGGAMFPGGVLLLEGFALIVFSQMTVLPLAILSMLVFSLFVQMSGGRRVLHRALHQQARPWRSRGNCGRGRQRRSGRRRVPLQDGACPDGAGPPAPGRLCHRRVLHLSTLSASPPGPRRKNGWLWTGRSAGPEAFWPRSASSWSRFCSPRRRRQRNPATIP